MRITLFGWANRVKDFFIEWMDCKHSDELYHNQNFMQETVDLVTLLKKPLIENFIFGTVSNTVKRTIVTQMVNRADPPYVFLYLMR